MALNLTPTLSFPLRTARLELRPFQMGDLEAMHAYHALPEVARYLYWEARDYAGSEQALQKRCNDHSLQKDDDALCLAVILSASQQLIGEVTLFLRSVEHQQGEIGYIFNPAFAGQGYATEATRRLLELGFQHYNFHRLYARCEAENIASYRLMERLAMRREAHMLQNEWVKGAWSSELLYALLQSEWRGRLPSETPVTFPSNPSSNPSLRNALSPSSCQQR